MRMPADEKVARQRLTVLQLAEALNNVSSACRQRGMTRTQFSDYKRRFELQGLEGLKDLPPIHKTHPQTTPPETVERIGALSLEHPAWGCVRLSERLKLDGVSVSSPTIQRILLKHQMGTKFDRLLRLEERAASDPIELSTEQITPLAKAGGGFRERHVASSRPGERLRQDTVFVGTFKGGGRSIGTPSSIPMAPTPSASCTRARSLRRRWRSCTTRSCPSIRSVAWRSSRS
jgi:Homeodomain-like domain